jgi:hypothetical protein
MNQATPHVVWPLFALAIADILYWVYGLDVGPPPLFTSEVGANLHGEFMRHESCKIPFCSWVRLFPLIIDLSRKAYVLHG